MASSCVSDRTGCRRLRERERELARGRDTCKVGSGGWELLGLERHGGFEGACSPDCALHGMIAVCGPLRLPLDHFSGSPSPISHLSWSSPSSQNTDNYEIHHKKFKK